MAHLIRIDPERRIDRKDWIAPGLAGRRAEVALLQAACALALEGHGRAAAGEIAGRTWADFGIDISASLVGQQFLYLGIPAVTSHGKRKYVLDHQHLEELRQKALSEYEAFAVKVEGALSGFKETIEGINNLEARWQETQAMVARDRELRQLIARYRQLEPQAEDLREQADYVQKLEEECRDLAVKTASLPELEQRQAALQQKYQEYQAQAESLASEEKKYLELIRQLKLREGWISLATLQQSIAQAREELDIISRQLGEKRSRLDRILRRKEARE